MASPESGIVNKFGYNPQAVAQHLYNDTTPNGAAAEAEQHHANRTIAEFDAKHTDPMSQHLRPMAAKILERGDKRLEGCRTSAETLDRAFALAWHDLPQKKTAARTLGYAC